MSRLTLLLALVIVWPFFTHAQTLSVQPDGYLGTHGFDVIFFNNNYPDGHQGGVELILHDSRLATNGDLRLEPTPGQWSPMPKLLRRNVDSDNETLTARLVYPDSSKNRTGFNPIEYPDLVFEYEIHITPGENNSVLLSVDLDEPIPTEWEGKIGFNLELFPQELFGKSYILDQQFGNFPRQAVGQLENDSDGELQAKPLATGRTLSIAPGSPLQQFTIENLKDDLSLFDGRFLHNNGWFIVRSLVPAGVTKNAIVWKITPKIDPDWRREPVIQVSQTGYHPNEKKRAIIEADSLLELTYSVQLIKMDGAFGESIIKTEQSKSWGKFLRYNYRTFDFSEVKEPGVYFLKFGEYKTHNFTINSRVHNTQTWQQTLEYFLPVQMCHMKVQEKYRKWHGACHLDDALMAPVDTNHFDGYVQGPKTLTKFSPQEHVPGLNAGGWHDAGDYDLRVESQAGTTYKLALMYELFEVDYDQTMINQSTKEVEIHEPDGHPDILQQVEHGLLTILGGYESLGRLYRGIIVNDLRQYVHLGDASTQTDNIPNSGINDSGSIDDRWVFTEENPYRVLSVIPSLAASYRVLKTYNLDLANRTLKAAIELYELNAAKNTPLNGPAINAAVELYLSTNDSRYLDYLTKSESQIISNISRSGWSVARILNELNDDEFKQNFEDALEEYSNNLEKELAANPYGVPYHPAIWGAAWGIESYAVNQFFLNQYYPELFPKENFLNALQYVLGVHQGSNTMSFVSGVGANSATTAYGVNRADWSYIPGGVISGTGLIRPNLPELKHWPFFWQQTEYVMGGAATDFMFLSLGAHQVLNSD